MADFPDEATRLNDEGTKLFEEGRFQEAGELYERANETDTTNSPMYLANLALVELRLDRNEKAEIYATQALLRDPRDLKARYRRGLARWARARHFEAFVDLASALTLDPTDKLTIAAFAKLSDVFEAEGEYVACLSPMRILQAEYPSAYGSPSAPRPQNSQTVSRADGAIVIPDDTLRVPKNRKGGACALCKNFAWDRKRVRACSGCTTAFYCDEICQRKHWPEHKKDCIPYDKTFALTMHLCKNLLQHRFIHMHLTIYALRSIGALHHSPPLPYPTFLLVLVGLVPLELGPKARRRISIRNIIHVPLAVTDKQTRDSYFRQREQMRKTSGDPNAAGIFFMVTPLITEAEHQSDPSQALTLMDRVEPLLVLMMNQSTRSMGIESHAFGVGRKLTPDLDELYWSLEDELANDVENYYGLQR
ncbi:RNA polymerase II-associated protein 3 [Mycena sanguinolenta]|uniref:RNA polymerase II-associated protein 3 n=1 Tax=Mycena sanguinolenta TaxID=230812 RepID=A0A8H6XU58_9AGAR|nr:RNA polymerase II-associated protein 3 [Mycena sanguinolenta]